MRIEISGEGPPVLFLHGGGVSGWMWRPVLERLNGGVRSIVPDLPGHGESGEADYASHDETVAGLLGIIRDTAPEGLHIVGFSLGAQLAMLLASRAPEFVHGAVLVSGEAIPAPMQRSTLTLLRWTAPLARREWFARAQARQLAVPEALVDDYLRDSLRLSRETLLASVAENIRFTPPAGWSLFGGKAIVMAGARERGLMRRSARLIHEMLPSSELVIVPGSAHDIPFTAPDALATAIRGMVGPGERAPNLRPDT